MDITAYLQELDAFKAERLSPIVGAGQTSLLGGASGDAAKRGTYNVHVRC